MIHIVLSEGICSKHVIKIGHKHILYTLKPGPKYSLPVHPGTLDLPH